MFAVSTLRPLTLAHVPGFSDTQSTAPQAWQRLTGRLGLSPKAAFSATPAFSTVWWGSVWNWHCSPQGRPSSAYGAGQVGRTGSYASLHALAALTLFREQLEHQQSGGTRTQPAVLQLSHVRALQELIQTPKSGMLATEASTAHSTLITAQQVRGGYEVMQTDIAAMRRLRVTKGIYLPADTPMHGIFGSKDVIHSWAIPGLGVKIDCIPGYSSHRRLVLR
jgi:heme/copper-type cytochrome/quinol oxidase subunit 2